MYAYITDKGAYRWPAAVNIRKISVIQCILYAVSSIIADVSQLGFILYVHER